MPLRDLLRPPRHLLVVFLAVTLLLATTLLWLSWQLVRQDEALVAQQIEERRESAADFVAAALQKALVLVEERLGDLPQTPARDLSRKAEEAARQWGADSVLVICRPDRVEAFPNDRLLFYPTRPKAAPLPHDAFERAEALEFLHENGREAEGVLRRLLRSRDPAVRAGALMRIARIQRKDGRFRDALATYADLAALGPTPVESLPADLVARHARLALLEALGERERLEREASALFQDVRASRWVLLRAEYGFYEDQAQRRLAAGYPRAPDPDAALSTAVESLWETWRSILRGDGASEGHRLAWFGDEPVVLLWRAASGTMAGLAAGPADVSARWLSPLQPALAEQGLGIVLTDVDGRPVSGRLTGDLRGRSARPASATSLPWNLHLVTLDAGARHAYFDARRRLLFAALSFIALLVLAGMVFLWRAVARETALSRLQADFVSAVSHEFRTPLTALRQFTELLLADRVASDDDRRRYYDAMARESGRLSRLVERLLDFGRMQAGALRYRLEPLDPAALVRDVVAEFERSGESRDHRLELNAQSPCRPVRADRETLACVVWNLLDNAAKYSPEGSTVRIEVEQENGATAIRVRDHGEGIPPGEREEVFRKFFRGAAARSGGIRGTGIGLAMAREIVAAHGGEIGLESTVGRGSTFTVRLPAGS